MEAGMSLVIRCHALAYVRASDCWEVQPPVVAIHPKCSVIVDQLNCPLTAVDFQPKVAKHVPPKDRRDAAG